MARTVQIQGSDEVMALFGKSDTFYRGKWKNIRVTNVSGDVDTPLEVRTALVGLTIPTIFTKESIEKQTGASFGELPLGSRLAYAVDVISALENAKKNSEAEQLRGIAGGPIDIYTFDPECYELCKMKKHIILFRKDNLEIEHGYQAKELRVRTVSNKLERLKGVLESKFDKPPSSKASFVKDATEYFFQGAVNGIDYSVHLVCAEGPIPILGAQSYVAKITLPEGKTDELTPIIEREFKQYEKEVKKALEEVTVS